MPGKSLVSQASLFKFGVQGDAPRAAAASPSLGPLGPSPTSPRGSGSRTTYLPVFPLIKRLKRCRNFNLPGTLGKAYPVRRKKRYPVVGGIVWKKT